MLNLCRCYIDFYSSYLFSDCFKTTQQFKTTSLLNTSIYGEGANHCLQALFIFDRRTQPGRRTPRKAAWKPNCLTLWELTRQLASPTRRRCCQNEKISASFSISVLVLFHIGYDFSFVLVQITRQVFSWVILSERFILATLNFFCAAAEKLLVDSEEHF